MLESFTDRVYLIKNYEGQGDEALGDDIDKMMHRLDRRGPAEPYIFDDPSVPPHTQYCHLVRPFDDLIGDLKRWKEEIPAAE